MITPRFSKQTIEFLAKADRQKRPDWLERERAEYERVLLEPLRHLAATARSRLAPVAPGYHFPQRGLGRLKRSAIRAREYRALYKNWLSYSASRPSESRFDHNPNLYFMIDPADDEGDRVLSAGGLYMPSSRQLRAVREAIAGSRDLASAFDRLFASREFTARFPGGFSPEKCTSRVPRGFDPSHPRISWIRLQAFFVWRPYSMREFCSATFAERVSDDWAQIVRMNDLLYQALSGLVRTETPVAAPSRLASRLEEIEAPRRKMDF